MRAEPVYGEGVAVSVGVADGVEVEVGVAVGEGVMDGVCVGVKVNVGEGVKEGVQVGDGVKVSVAQWLALGSQSAARVQESPPSSRDSNMESLTR
jgi:hypothetical protein